MSAIRLIIAAALLIFAIGQSPILLQKFALEVVESVPTFPADDFFGARLNQARSENIEKVKTTRISRLWFMNRLASPKSDDTPPRSIMAWCWPHGDQTIRDWIGEVKNGRTLRSNIASDWLVILIVLAVMYSGYAVGRPLGKTIGSVRYDSLWPTVAFIVAFICCWNATKLGFIVQSPESDLAIGLHVILVLGALVVSLPFFIMGLVAFVCVYLLSLIIPWSLATFAVCLFVPWCYGFNRGLQLFFRTDLENAIRAQTKSA